MSALLAFSFCVVFYSFFLFNIFLVSALVSFSSCVVLIYIFFKPSIVLCLYSCYSVISHFISASLVNIFVTYFPFSLLCVFLVIFPSYLPNINTFSFSPFVLALCFPGHFFLYPPNIKTSFFTPFFTPSNINTFSSYIDTFSPNINTLSSNINPFLILIVFLQLQILFFYTPFLPLLIYLFSVSIFGNSQVRGIEAVSIEVT